MSTTDFTTATIDELEKRIEQLERILAALLQEVSNLFDASGFRSDQ